MLLASFVSNFAVFFTVTVCIVLMWSEQNYAEKCLLNKSNGSSMHHPYIPGLKVAVLPETVEAVVKPDQKSTMKKTTFGGKVVLTGEKFKEKKNSMA